MVYRKRGSGLIISGLLRMRIRPGGCFRPECETSEGLPGKPRTTVSGGKSVRHAKCFFILCVIIRYNLCFTMK